MEIRLNPFIKHAKIPYIGFLNIFLLILYINILEKENNIIFKIRPVHFVKSFIVYTLNCI